MVAAGGSKGAVFTGFKWIANYLYKRASGIICLARGTKEYLRDEFDIPSDKLFFVPNGVNTSAFGSRKAYERNTVTFVYAGAHGPANGLDAVVKAANLLRHRDDLRFLLVGDGPAKQSLQQIARDLGTHNVEFLGTVPKSEVSEVFRSADAGLMVLRETPLFAFGVSPNKLFDYMGAALPVVSNVPGEVAWMVEQAEAGEQAADGSPEELAAAIERLADRSAEERAQLGRSGRAWVTREHSRTVLAERLDGVLRNLLL
jgi:glycosyltransferase involved in cell wall biosynthesis